LLWRGFLDPGNVPIRDTDAVDDGGAWNVLEEEMGHRKWPKIHGS